MDETQSTIFIIDDDASVRKSLQRLLRAHQYQVETFASGQDYLSREPFGGIGAIVLDIQMPGLTGMDVQSQLLAQGANLPIIFLTGHGDIPTTVTAMKRGAVNFLTKPVDETALLQTIRDGLQRHIKIHETSQDQEILRQRLSTLTSREHEVMRYVIGGALNKQIAHQLDIAEKTVKVHRAHMLEKMRVTSVAELVHVYSDIEVSPLQTSKKFLTDETLG